MTVLELGFNQITHVGLEYLLTSLCGYTTLNALHLDNNMIGDLGAEMLAAALPAITNLELLDIGFNSISTAGIRSIMGALRDNTSIRSLILSGNTLDTEGAKAVAWALEANTRLEQLYLDHTSIGPAGERLIAGGLAANRNFFLKTFTGFRLGNVLVRLGCPPGIEGVTNEQALDILRARAMGEVPVVVQQAGHCGLSPVAGQVYPRALSGIYAAIQPQPQPGMIPGASGGPSAFTFPGEASTRLLSSSQAAGLAEIANMPYEASDLWMLHQYYFSPPPNPQMHNPQPQLQFFPSAGMTTTNSEEHLPPTKRQCNNSTKTRVAYYPRLKVKE